MLPRVLRRRKSALVGALILAVVALAALFAPALAPHDPIKVRPAEALSPPSLAHPFGTDQYGRDILSRAMTGARLSLLSGLGAVAVALTAGVVVGLACGVIGGWTDLLVMRVVDIMMAFPGILMALVVVAVLGQGTVNVMLAVGVSLIPTFVRLVRGDVLSVRENAYVEAARALGCWPARVALRHVLPNVVAPIIVLSTVAIAWSIILGASLSFLGLGPRPPIRVGHRSEQRAQLSPARMVDLLSARLLHHAHGGGGQPGRRCPARRAGSAPAVARQSLSRVLDEAADGGTEYRTGAGWTS